MKKIMFFCFQSLTTLLFSQTIDSVAVRYDVVSYCCFGDEGNGSENTVVYYIKSGSSTVLGSRCFAYDGPINGVQYPYAKQKVANVPHSIILDFEAFEDDCNDRCSFGGCCFCVLGICDDCDDNHAGWQSVDIVNYNFPPEKYYIIYDTAAGVNGKVFGGTTLAKYSFPSLELPLVYRKNHVTLSSGTVPIICPHDTLYINTNYQVYNGAFINGVKTGVKFKWEVQLNFSGNWKTIDTSLDSTFKFVPIDRFPEFDTMALQGDLSFRVTALGEEGSRTSNSSNYKIMPRAPRATVYPFASCPDQSNGKVDVNFINGIGSSYRYILKHGFNQNSGCDPDSNNCFIGQASSGTNVTAPSYTIPSIGAGKYTLWLINEGGYKGSCYNTYNVQVDSFPLFKVTLDSSKNVTCKNGNDGAIFLHSNKTFPVYYIQPLLNASSASYIVQDTIFKIQNLKHGTYSVSVKDYCNVYTTPINITITEPTRVVGSITQAISPSCVTPANGTITISADSGSGIYNYFVYKSGNLIDSLINSTSNIFYSTSHSEGTYKIEIQDATRSTCPGYIEYVNLNYPSSMYIDDSVVDLSCYQSENGQIILKGNGNTGGYNYLLYSFLNGTTTSNTNGEFYNLSRGFYKEILKRNIVGCLDSVFRDSVLVSQPIPLTSTIVKQNVTCLGKDDGFITVTAKGGTPPYTYQWEFKNSSGWAFYYTPINSSTITDLYPAFYRVKITDKNTCSIYSDSVDVREPNALQFDSIHTNNIKCFGETATIQCYASGGTPPYTFSYSLDNGSTYTPFNSTTGLYSGTYKLKLSDANNCSVVYPVEQIINSPSQPLNFNPQLSDFNGYNVSCKNSTNGVISLLAMGGNDYGYSGYSYSINSNAFSIVSIFNGLSAGIYQIKVKDGRDCIVSKTITLKEPDELTSSILSVDTIKCGNDTNGIITVANIGGIAPYFGRIIGEDEFIIGTKFINLKLGNYNFEIKDTNGCLDTISSNMVSRFPRLLYKYSSEDVKCYGSATGKLQVIPYGGLPPYKYIWRNNSFGNESTINMIPKGIYSFEVKDSVQCSILGSIVISQPDSLEFTVDEVPVCPNTNKGEFRINAKGGKKPYLYSLDSIDFQSIHIIKDIFPLVEHILYVRDSNQCITSKKASIIIYPDSIKADFVISTKELTLDTIRAVDITVPKPDSVHWTYSTNTNVITRNNAITEVYFNTQGDYNITMRTFNKLCENVVSKNITVKVKDTSIYRPHTTSIIDSFTVFPIPNNGVFSLYLATNKIYPLVYVQMTNNIGKVVYTKSYNYIKLINESIDLTSLAKGTYFLRVFVENDYRVKVIIIE